MPFILDCSVTMAWVFDDERTGATDALRDSLIHDTALVPALWAMEVSNVMRSATLRGRLQASDWVLLQDALLALPIQVDTMTNASVFKRVLPLAWENDLSVYDATYLELALREVQPIATLDKALARAARSNGLTVLGAA